MEQKNYGYPHLQQQQQQNPPQYYPYPPQQQQPQHQPPTIINGKLNWKLKSKLKRNIKLNESFFFNSKSSCDVETWLVMKNVAISLMISVWIDIFHRVANSNICNVNTDEPSKDNMSEYNKIQN